MTELAREVQARARRRYSYRFLFIPGTIGSITWLALNEERAGRIAHGLVAANLGDPGAFHYKQSRRGNSEIDRAVLAVLRGSGEPFGTEEFVSVRLRRAAVLLARVQPGGGLAHPDALRPLS